ncbi:MAG: aldose 1-epimerase family protein [Actinobacteria bacterium]|nr:aldose 1-epimerase family protein [Actinomycetota bacterium]MCG2801320.1 aldose 1-epimerase family protein [Cellulomonas sp.]
MTSPTGLQHVLTHGDQRAVVTQVGASLRSYTVAGTDVVLSYGEDELFPAYAGSVLAPWPNRLADGQYEVDGVAYQVPLNEPDRNNALHGLTPYARFDATAQSPSAVTLTHTLVPTPGYPWAVQVAVTYTLDDAGLTVATVATYDGPGSAPFGIGFHPWLEPGPGGVDACTLTLDADEHVLVDDRLLPVGTEPTDPALAGAGVALAGVVLDDAWSAARHDGAGWTWARLHRSDGRTTVIRGDRAVTAWQVCTGNAIPRIDRAAVAVEPMSCIADAFRTGTDLVQLTAGSRHELSWTLQLL